ncbi:MAG: outer membrane lipoprotein chaperone LolA [Pseudomonadales bacterium]|jgi:outer membrane lipoprotein carrier protein|nr:outer membrane lipoprotein chaperone LolA [Pseudomonadales bacterium]MDP4640436.1 outer membrane lipoprotein chaperone LolA [Pseudomonadales bacterium]MDP4766033.1 outer membrane lipoprotein chaperone LolA [Pseudomonadales bacterium]MDP4875231.1 outer membrane lipoprotein chaperone LolA [Pseudomonadales bacterium]MDP4910940.1 outer membrane lipoprotein chaperone LolA [Pseudomonadales bacterium]
MRRRNSASLRALCIVSITLGLLAPVVVQSAEAAAAAGGAVAGRQVGETFADIDRTLQLAALLDQLQTLRAAFIQTTTDKNRRVVQQTRGQLWVSAPGRFRLETVEPAVQTLVSDGESFWSYDSDLDQVIITPLQHDISQVPILLLGGDAGRITEQYLVVHYAADGHEFYVLKPRDTGSLFEALTIEFAEALPVSIVLRDSLGQHTAIELADVSPNQQVDAAVYTFITPPGVDVIDDR